MRLVSLLPLFTLSVSPLARSHPLPAHSPVHRDVVRDLASTAVGFVSQVLSGISAIAASVAPAHDAKPVEMNTLAASTMYTPPARLAQAAYCSTAAVRAWKCGPACAAFPRLEVLATGGDGTDTPRYFVAYDPSARRIVVAHQGTDESSMLSVLNDAELLPSPLDDTLFPHAPLGVLVHDGFRDAQARSANGVLTTVRAALAQKKVTKVLVTGHSLGAAIAVLDAVMLKENLEPSVHIEAIVFGLPRCGNQEWANLVDNDLGSHLTHIANKADPMPSLPPLSLGYVHPSGLVHILKDDATGAPSELVSCKGQENDSPDCAPVVLAEGTLDDHYGPYFAQDVMMSSSGCPL